MIFGLYNVRVKVVVDIDPFSSILMYLILTLATFFLYRINLQSRMVPILSCEILIQGTSPIFNFRHFDSACEIPSQMFLSNLSYFVCSGVVKGSWARLSCR